MSIRLLAQKRDFRLLWLAQLVAFVGEGIFQTAMIWWVVQKTGSGTLVGFIMSVSFLPAVLLGPFAGTLADRLPSKMLLIGADSFRALLVMLFTWLAAHELLEINHLFIMCGLLSAAGVFHSPTTMAVIPRVVPPERIEEAMALHTIVRDISKLAGPALGGAIIAAYSVAEAFGALALCLMVSAVAISFMKIPSMEAPGADESVWGQLKSGFVYVWRQGILGRILMAFGFLNLFVIPIIVLLPMAIAKVFVIGGEKMAENGVIPVAQWTIKGSLWLGISEGVLALGSVLTGLLFHKLFANVATSRLMIRTLLVNGFLFLLFALNRSFPVFIAGLFFLGGCFTAVNVAILSLFQKTVAPEFKGRFFALVEVLSFALFPVALAAAGALSDHIGVAGVFVLCGTGILGVAAAFMRMRDLHRLDRDGGEDHA